MLIQKAVESVGNGIYLKGVGSQEKNSMFPYPSSVSLRSLLPDCRHTVTSFHRLLCLPRWTVSLQTVSQMHCPSSSHLCHSNRTERHMCHLYVPQGPLQTLCPWGFEECPTLDQGEMSFLMLFSPYRGKFLESSRSVGHQYPELTASMEVMPYP